MDSKEIDKKIDELREVLNELMGHEFRKDYKRILELSVQLDYLINECYKLKDNKS